MTKPHDREAFARRLQQAIDESDLMGVPQGAVGKEFGVKGASVSYWLGAKKMPDMGHAIIVARRLNVAVEWLLTGRGTMRITEGASRQSLALIGTFERLSPRGKGELLGYASFVAAREGDKPGSEHLKQLAEEISPGVTP